MENCTGEKSCFMRLALTPTRAVGKSWSGACEFLLQVCSALVSECSQFLPLSLSSVVSLFYAVSIFFGHQLHHLCHEC